MLKVSLRNVLANKLRLLLTIMAVTVGVTFVSGTFVLSDTMFKAFDELYDGLTSGTAVVVRSEAAFEADIATTGGQTRPLDEEIVAVVGQVPGVEVVEGAVSGFALVLDEDGDPIQPGGAPTIGASVPVDRRLAGAAQLQEGRAPVGPNEMLLDARTVQKAGYRIGDTVDVVFADGRRSFTLVALMSFGDTDSLLGATYAGFDLPTAQRVLGKVGRVDEIDVVATEGVSAPELRDRIDQELPDGVEALTGDQVAAQGTAAVRDSMGIFTTVLLVFAAISVLVGSFVIWNTFNILVTQRRREVGLLRAVGATRSQVLAGVLVEAALVGLMAGGAGILLGLGFAIGVREALDLIGVEIPSTTPALSFRTIAAGLVVGVVVTIAAAGVPAWLATRVEPMEALRSPRPAAGIPGRRRRAAGWLVTTFGAATLGACAIIGNLRWATVGATLVTFVGLVTVGPSLARGVAALANQGAPGGPWRLAARNIARNSRRASATALALTIGLTVVVAVAVTASSLKESVAVAVSGGNRSDLILEPAGAGIGISPAVATLLRTQEDVAEVVELRESAARVNGSESLVTGADANGLDQVIDLGIVSGSLEALTPGGLLVAAGKAEDLGVAVGDTVSVTFPETGDRTMTVVGTFDRGSLVNATYVMTMPDFAANVTSNLDAAIMVKHSPGVEDGAGKSAIAAALVDYPNVTVNDPADVTQSARDSVDQLLGLVTALLMLAVIVAVLGIVNTLVLSVVDRTRELGLLRAVGATSRQVRMIIRRESVLMSVLGSLVGVALGTICGVALSRALVDEGITEVSVPGWTLVSYFLIAAGVGLVAAVGPARRAGRVDVLTAITTE